MLTTLLDHFPEAVVLLGDDRVLYINTMAAHYLPKLSVGDPVPAFLDLPACEAFGAGNFSAGGTFYAFSRTHSEEGVYLFFRPAPQTALTAPQLESALRQLRELMGEFLMELGPHTGPGQEPPDADTLTDFVKSYHRAFRLMNNLNLLSLAATPEGTPFRPTAMDLAGLCRRLTDNAAALLAEAGTQLHFESQLPSLLINGDSSLLTTLLLGLISNCAQAARGGSITLRLRQQGDRALLRLSDSGRPLSPEKLSALLQEGDPSRPLCGQGAGLGLSVVRHIISLHGGTMLVEWGEASPATLVSLPIGKPDLRLSVKTPRFETGGGLDPLLVGLSDVLPSSAFAPEGLD